MGTPKYILHQVICVQIMGTAVEGDKDREGILPYKGACKSTFMRDSGNRVRS